MNHKELWYITFFKFKYRRGYQMIQPFCRIRSPQEIKLTLFNLRKFLKSEKSVIESFKRHWNLINDEEFGSFKFSKLKYKRGDQIIQPFCRIGFLEEIRSLPLESKSKKSAAESCRMRWNIMKFEKIEIQKEGSSNSVVLQNRLPQRNEVSPI